MKKIFLLSHRWFGLIAGLHFVLLGLSGSYLVYPEFFEKLLFAQRYELESSREWQSLEDIISDAQTALKRADAPTGIQVPWDQLESVQVTFKDEVKDGKSVSNTYFYDPTSKTVLDKVSFLGTLRGFLFKFHHDLFLGRVGRTIMGISGLLCLALLLSGLYLWWPKRGQFKKALFRIRTKSLLPFTLDAHKVIGLYTLLLMLLVTFTGLYISVPSWFGGGRSGPSKQMSRPKKTVSPMEVYREADRLLGRFEEISLREHPRAKKFFLSSKDLSMTYDPESGSFISNDGGDSKSTRRTMGELHEGDFWSQLGPFLIFISGILPLFFYISGIYLWIRKSKGKMF